jgi:SnoaL-like domain
MLNRDLASLSAQAVELAFYEAISAGDIDALMQLWAEQDDIVCIHPGSPRLVGYAAIRASWEAMFERGSLQVHASQLHTVHTDTCAIHNVVEDVIGSMGFGDFDDDESEEDDDDEAHEDDSGEGGGMHGSAGRGVYLLATNIYIKTRLGWRMVLHHVSLTPGNAPPANYGLLH